MAEWSNDLILLFLELYEAEPVLWNPKHHLHKNKVSLREAWLKIAATMNKQVDDLKKKKESLMAAFRKHAKKKKDSLASGAGVNDVYQPSWFAFSYMERFLHSIYELEITIHTEQNEENGSPYSINEKFLDDNSSNANHSTPTPEWSRFREPRRRRSQNPLELQEDQVHMNSALTTLNNILAKSVEQDDCDLFAKLIAIKLRKIPEQEREDIMHEIYELVHDKIRSRRRGGVVRNQSISVDATPSSQYIVPTPLQDMNYTTPSPQHSSPQSPYAQTTQQILAEPGPSRSHIIPSMSKPRINLLSKTKHIKIQQRMPRLHLNQNLPNSKRVKIIKTEKIPVLRYQAVLNDNTKMAVKYCTCTCKQKHTLPGCIFLKLAPSRRPRRKL